MQKKRLFICALLAAPSLAFAFKGMSDRHICAAGLLTAKILSSNSAFLQAKNGVVYFDSRKPDGARITYQCKLEGNRILWKEAEGQWHDKDVDSVITFVRQRHSDDALVIKIISPDGRTTAKDYWNDDDLWPGI